MNITIQLRLDAVEYYLSGNDSLRSTARRFNVHYLSLYQWVKWYQQGGKENLVRKRPYRKPWNSFPEEMQERVMILKENEPTLTVRKAKDIFKKQNVNISLKGIWSIWKRYGLAGVPHNKSTLSFDITAFAETRGIKAKICTVEELLNNNRLEEAARVLNDLPYCPNTGILDKIPDKFLSLRRQVEKFPTLFGKVSFPAYRNKMKSLRQKLEKSGLYYSSLRIGIEEALALQWMGKPSDMISLIDRLALRLQGKCEPSIRISLSLLKGIACSMLFKIKEARQCLARCNKNLLVTFPFLNLDMAAFCTSIGDFKKAIFFAEQGLRYTPERSKKILYEMLSYLYSIAGDYRASIASLRKGEEKSGRLGLTAGLVRAQHMVEQGMFANASELVQRILRESKKEVVLSHLHAISLIQASISAALGDLKKARDILKRYIPILKKSKMKRDIAIRNALLGRDLPAEALQFPSIRLAVKIKKAAKSLKERDYRKSFDYAAKNALSGVFYRFILFFPDVVNSLLARGKTTRLRRTMLRLPIFNRNTPVYNIRFLGTLIIHKNEEYLPVRLRPKDAAFLIRLSLSAPEKGKAVNLDEIYRSFWADSKNPARNFSHMLVRVKKALKIPAHLLTISAKTSLPSLLNEGIYFMTDYHEVDQALIQAQALARAGEWRYSKEESLRAFKLFRGDPLRRNYDSWSLDLRHRILTHLETEAVNFAQSCIEHNSKYDALKVLEKTLKIVPNADGIVKMINTLNKGCQ